MQPAPGSTSFYSAITRQLRAIDDREHRENALPVWLRSVSPARYVVSALDYYLNELGFAESIMWDEDRADSCSRNTSTKGSVLAVPFVVSYLRSTKRTDRVE